jgi:hypothetical protein
VPSQELYCAICEAVMPFEPPPVNDHDIDDYPELACTRCGDAILFAPLTVVAITLHSCSRHVAPQQRQAA